jgi:metallophosphoesterase (TIGR03767 family)
VSGGLAESPPLTTQRRLAAGAVVRRGTASSYRVIEFSDGERHVVRSPFGTRATGPESGGRPLLCLAHITDLQLADVQSPARFEFLNRYYADPRYAQLVPVQRPQEALTARAVDATIRTLNAVRGPATGMPPQLAVSTGDAIDNAQWNELELFLALFDGGVAAPRSGGPRYEGVQSLDWPDDAFWKPDGIGPRGPDLFRRELGFPHHPGLLRRALRRFRASGLVMPWLSCFGNHEALTQGVGVPTDGITAALTGGRKPVGLPDGFDHDRALDLFTTQPEMFLTGPSRGITPDPARRAITRGDFVAAHFRPGARPHGHGFTERNRLDGTAYYAYDMPGVRLVVLDTSCLAGGASGCIDEAQARWLRDRLAEVHSVYEASDGTEVRTTHDDRLVVLLSHHGLDTLERRRAGHAGPGGMPLLGAPEVRAELHRFPNVVLWLNGHAHVNAIRPRAHPSRPDRGFWEVTTCAVVDWPCQTRLVELIDRGGCLSIVCTMVDHDTPPVPGSLTDTAGLAALHRELAANVPLRGALSACAGQPGDRNADLRIVPPFPLGRLPAMN